MGSHTEPVMGAVLSSIPLCSRAGDTAAQEPDKRPEDRQSAPAVVAQPLSPQLQSNTSETCSATGIDNENHQENHQEIVEKTTPVQEVEQLQTPVVEEHSQEPSQEPEPELEEDDGNVEVSLDDSQSDEWSLEKEVEGESQDKVEEVEVEEDQNCDQDQDHFRKTSPELDTAAAITNILSEIVGGESNDS